MEKCLTLGSSLLITILGFHLPCNRSSLLLPKAKVQYKINAFGYEQQTNHDPWEQSKDYLQTNMVSWVSFRGIT